MAESQKTIPTKTEAKAADSSALDQSKPKEQIQFSVVDFIGQDMRWAQLTERSDNPLKLQAWITLTVEGLLKQGIDIKQCALLMRESEGNAFSLRAFWPIQTSTLENQGSADLLKSISQFNGLIEKTIETGLALTSVPAGKAETVITLPLIGRYGPHGTIILTSALLTNATQQNVTRQLYVAASKVSESFHEQAFEQMQQRAVHVGSVMELASHVLSHDPLKTCLLRMVNAIAQLQPGTRAAIGWVHGNTGNVRVEALSNTAVLDKRGAISQALQQAMQESVARASSVLWLKDEKLGSANLAGIHADLGQISKSRSLYSVPLQHNGKTLGAMTFLREAPIAFDKLDRQWIDTLASLLPQAIDQKIRSEQHTPKVFLRDLKSLASRVVGPKHFAFKFVTASAVLLTAILLFVPMPFRVAAKTVIEGEIQRAAIAPFEGFLSASFVRPGDTVKKNQPLFSLDDRDLLVEKSKWNAEKEQAEKKLREAMATNEMASIAVMRAQQAQAEAQLKLVSLKLERSIVRASFDGTVISGDLAQLIGSPVENGKKLLEIAPLDTYRVILQIDERDIGLIAVNQSGEALLPGLSSESLPLKVTRITSIATAVDGRNFFRVEAALENAKITLRPGIEGVGKIKIGERSVGFVATRNFMDWARLALWNYIP
jgi:hypothetical protein